MTPQAETGQANIGPRERRVRLAMAVVMVVLAGYCLWVFHQDSSPRWYRLAVFVPLWLASMGWIQARRQTCVMFAAMGTCNLDDGPRKLQDPAQVARFRSEAVKVLTEATLLAAAATAVGLLLP